MTNNITTKFQYDEIIHSVNLNGLVLQELTDKTIPIIASWLVDTRKKQFQPLKISAMAEGFPVKFVAIFDKVLHYIIENNLADKNDFEYHIGAENTDENFLNYQKICQRYKLIQLPIKFHGTPFEKTAARECNTYLKFFNTLDTFPRKKLKLFLSLNHAPRDHRIFLLATMIDTGLIDQSYFSYISDPNWTLTNLVESVPFSFPQNYKKIKTIVENNFHKLPILIDNGEFLKRVKLPNFDDYPNFDEMYFYDKSYISLVTETKFHQHIENTIYSDQHDLVFLSEKTFKPIQMRHPFILFGYHGSLEALRKKGYQTFHPWINEDYDTIENSEDRAEFIVNEMTRLSQFSNDEWTEFQFMVRGALEHNFATLLSKAND